MTSKKKLKRRNKKLQYKMAIQKHQRKLAEKDAKFWRGCVEEQDIEMEKMEAEIKELKAPKIKMWNNGEEVEFIGSVSPRMLSSKNHPCDKCGEIVPNDDWEFLLCMCQACANDKSRWQCLGCRDNLGLEAPPYEGDFHPIKDVCEKCSVRIQSRYEGGAK